MIFLRLFKSFWQVQESMVYLQNLSPVWFLENMAIISAAYIFWLYRKPPDKFVCFDSIVIQVKSQRRWWSKIIIFTTVCLLSIFLFTNPPNPFTNDYQQPSDMSKEESKEIYETVTEMGFSKATNADVYSFMADNENLLEEKARDIGNWDSDDFPIVVDSATSRTITPYFEDLIDPRPYVSNLRGIGNGKITHVGMVRWVVEDINGKTTYIEDPEAYYSKDAPYRLLCPHSWRESLNKKRYSNGETEGEGATMCLDPNDGGGYILSWNRGKTVVQATLDPIVNLPMIRCCSTYTKYRTYAAAFHCNPTIIPDDDDEQDGDEYIDEVFFDDEIDRSKEEQFLDGFNDKEPKIQVDDPLTHRDEAQFFQARACTV